MELKTARLTLLIDPNKKSAFERLCARQDRTPSQVVRQMIRDYLAEHDVSYVGSGDNEVDRSVQPSKRPKRALPQRAARPSRPATKRQKG